MICASCAAAADWDRRPMPAWEQMGPRQQAGWIEVGKGMRRRV